MWWVLGFRERNADVLLDRLCERLTDTYGIREFRRFKKEAARPADFDEAFLRDCDAVLAAVCD